MFAKDANLFFFVWVSGHRRAKLVLLDQELTHSPILPTKELVDPE